MALWSGLTGLFRSRARLEAEILVLRQQINVLRRKSPRRFAFGNLDRLVFVGLYRLVPGILDALAIVRPETVIRWHRAGFRSFWRWKSRPRGGRPRATLEIRKRSDRGGTSRPGSGSCRSSTQAAARSGSAISANKAIALCAACSRRGRLV